MTFITVTRAFVAANEVKTSQISGKPYRVITIKEDTGYFDTNDKWQNTGTISYGLTARGNRARRYADINTGDEVTATMSNPRPFNYINEDGTPGSKLTGNLESIGVISTRATRATHRNTSDHPQQQPASPKAQAISAARRSQTKTRTERTQTTQETRPNPPVVTTNDGAEGRQPNETPEQYRARQTRQGQRANQQNQAAKAHAARVAATPQGTDLRACADPRCGGRTFERSQLTRAGYCNDHKRARTTTQPTPEPANA